MLFSLLICLVTAPSEAAVAVFELLDEELLSEVCEDIACGSCEQTAVLEVSLSSSSMEADDLNLLRFGVQLLKSVDCSLVNGGTKMASSCMGTFSAPLDSSGSSSGSSSIGDWLEVVVIIPG